MKISSFDKLFEYPDYNQTGTQAKATAATKSVTAPGKKPSNVKPPSPTTSGVPTDDKQEPAKPVIAKAKELEKDSEFPSEKGNVVKVVSPIGQGLNKAGVVVQDQKTKEFYTLDPEDDIALPQVGVEESGSLDNIIDKNKERFAKKIVRKQNKLKQLIRAARFGDTYGEGLYEINFNNKELIQNVLDAPIQCGFEAETVWNNIESTPGIDLNYAGWSDIEGYVEEYEGERGVDRLVTTYKEWLMEEKVFDIQGDMIASEAKDRLEDENYMNEFVDSEINQDDVEDYKEDLKRNDPEDYKEKATGEFAYDESAWGREYAETVYSTDDIIEWHEEQMRDNGEYWDEAWDDAMNHFDMDYWANEAYSGWGDALYDHDIFLPGVGEEEYGLDEVASQMEDWASNNSQSNDVRPGGYHSGKQVDNEYWRVEEDSSIEGDGAGAEIISPVYDTPREMIQEMNSLFEFLKENNVDTNRSTGLHITMSMSGEPASKMDPLKLAILLNDKYVLSQFGRMGNSYTKSQLERLEHTVRRMNTDAESNKDYEASWDEVKTILSRSIDTNKFNAINYKDATNADGNNLVEFRIAGGSDYLSKMPEVTKSVLRYAATLQASHDPELYKKDFAKALYKLVSKTSDPLTPTQRDATINLPETPFVQGAREVLKKTGDQLDALEELHKAYQHLEAGDMPQAQTSFTNFMRQMLYSVYYKLDNFKTSTGIVRGMRDGLKTFGLDSNTLMQKLQNINVQTKLQYSGANFDPNKLSGEMANTLSKLLMKKVASPEPHQVLKVPATSVVYIRRGSYAGQRDIKSAVIGINDLKVIEPKDHREVSRAGAELSYPSVTPEEAAEHQKVIDAFNAKYGIKYSHPGTGTDPNGWNLANSTDPVWKEIAANNGVMVVRESKDFNSLSLQEQLKIVSKISLTELNKVWYKKRSVEHIPEADQVKAKERKPKLIKPNTGHESPHPYDGRLVGETETLNPPSIEVGDEVKVGKFKNSKATVKGFTKDQHGQPVLKTNKGDKPLYKPRVSKLEPKNVKEGAVPETNLVDEYRQIMSKPLLGSDIKGQMYAYQIVPDPSMIKEFRNQIAHGGRDVDLRMVFKGFAQSLLHPDNKKKVGLDESLLQEAPAELLADFEDTLTNYIMLKTQVARACKNPKTAPKCDVLSTEMANFEQKLSKMRNEIAKFTAKARDVSKAKKAGGQETLTAVREYKNKVDYYLNKLSDKISGGFEYIVMTDSGIEELGQTSQAAKRKQQSEIASVDQIKQALLKYFDDPELFNVNPDFNRKEVLAFLQAAAEGKILSMEEIMKIGTDPDLPETMTFTDIVAKAAENNKSNKFIQFYNKLVDDGIMYQTVANTTSGNVGPGELALLLLAAPATKGVRGDLNVGGREVEIKSGSYGKGGTAAGGKFNSDYIVKGNLAGNNLRKGLTSFFKEKLGKSFDIEFKKWMEKQEKPNTISSKYTRYNLIPKRMNMPSISNGSIAEVYNPFFAHMGLNRDQYRTVARLLSQATFSDEAKNKGGHLNDVFSSLGNEFDTKNWYRKQIEQVGTASGLDGEKLKKLILALQFASYQLNKGHDQILYINKTNQKLTNVTSAKDLIDKYEKGLVVTAKDINLTDTQQTAAHSVTAGL